MSSRGQRWKKGGWTKEKVFQRAEKMGRGREKGRRRIVLRRLARAKEEKKRGKGRSEAILLRLFWVHIIYS
jgi:hypothetical protein